ncbi:MAG: OmpH family outer membrane protein, partial [Petrimonas sp.]|nr:OmpH family outer membrane protein [Petrimonas sp.]
MNRTKLISLSVLFLTISATLSAQNSQVTVAYVNTTDLLNAFPAKEAATQKLIVLSENYKKELELMQNEYNKKYSDYITYQSSLA